MIMLGRAAIILMLNLMLLTGCDNSGKREFSPIAVADEYIRTTRPNLIPKYPIRKLDENKGFWLVYYFPRPEDSDFDPSRLGRNGFIVGVDKQTGQADFAGFQQ